MIDPGRAPERTRLAWRRTVLALAVTALLCLRLALAGGIGAGQLLVAAIAIMLWLGALLVTFRRRRALVRPGSGIGRTLQLCAGIAVTYALLGAILILVTLTS